MSELTDKSFVFFFLNLMDGCEFDFEVFFIQSDAIGGKKHGKLVTSNEKW